VVIAMPPRVPHSIEKLQNLNRNFSSAANPIPKICCSYRSMLIKNFLRNLCHFSDAMCQKKMIQGNERDVSNPRYTS